MLYRIEINGLEKNNGQIKNGATYLAIKTGTKIVSVEIKGTMKLFSKIIVNFGEPIDYISKKTTASSENG